MAGVGGKSVGRVTIRVVPDATRFREDLKKTLTRIEKSNVLKINVDADMRPAERTIKRFIDHWSGQEIHLNVDVNGATLSNARIAQAARPRVVPLNLEVTKASVAKVGAAIAALSGARLGGDIFKGVGERLANLDRALPKIAAVASSIASLAAVGISAGGGLATLAASLSSILAVSALAPALIVGAGVSVAVLAVALSQMGDRLGDVIDRWKGLGDVIGDGFWDQAAQHLRELSDSIFPGIRDGLAGTAGALGSWTASLAQGFQSALSGAALEQMFGRLNESIAIASSGTGAFASALVNLGLVGSDYLPRLAQWISDLTTRFDEFVGAAAADGRLKGWIDTGITAAQELGSVLFSAGSIISSIADAAQAAGGGGIATLASSLAGIAEVFKSSGVQEALTTLFTGAAAGAAGLATAFAPLGNLIGTLAPAIADIFSGAGAGLGEFIGRIADALARPEFQTGLTGLFDGILAGIDALGPSLPALADALGSVGTFAGILGAQLGEVLGAGIEAVAPVVTTLLESLEPLIPVLGDALVGAFEALAPVLSDAATTLLPPLVQALSEIVPALLPLIEELLPVLIESLPIVAELFSALAPLLVPFLETLTLIAGVASDVLVPALDLIKPVVEILVASLTTATDFMNGALQTALLLISGLMSGDMTGALDAIGALWEKIWQGIIDMQEKVGTAIGDFVTKLLENFGVAKDSAEDIGESISDFFGGLAEGVQGMVEDAVRNVTSFIDGIVSGVRTAVETINRLFGGVKGPDTSGARGGGGGSFGDPPELARGAVVLPVEGGTVVRLAEAGRSEAVVDEGRLNRLIELSNAQLAQQQQVPAGDRPVYMDGGALFGVIREIADGSARLVVNDALDLRDQDSSRGRW
ncbi:hypothetical protein C5B93_01105 [Rathayibacter sp. AY1A2]|uniref:phage tail protein n=1 Tax=Rathayibacter sp. AY1A2 TaxID=2080520 RepID=UPI000CE7AC65|nr:hypothetical protein [Rathayibacter sp. AY1A2]PPF41340.1 hypothetical protein C5B93_01105 [Rathayibacter sp. AY1A2]